MDALAAQQFDYALSELAEADAAAGKIGVFFRQAEDVALGRVRVHPQQQIRRRKMEEAECVGLQHLSVVDEPPLFLGSNRHLNTKNSVAGLGTGQNVAHRADTADARHQAGHLMERAAFAHLLEAAEFDDVELGGSHRAVVVEVDRNLCVSFDSGNRVDENSLSHQPNLLLLWVACSASSKSTRKR